MMKKQHFSALALTLFILTFFFSCKAPALPRGEETESLSDTNIAETNAKESETVPSSSSETEHAMTSETEHAWESETDANTEHTLSNGVPIEQALLEKMTTEEKIGQLFLCRAPEKAEEGKEILEKYHVGGFIFFAKNFKNETPGTFRSMIEEYQSVSKVALLTAVDEEGGTVCRVSLYPSFREEKFASPAELYAEGGMEGVLRDSEEKSRFLLSLGINFNLAPVADVSETESDFIYDRTIGLDAAGTAEYISSVVRKMSSDGIICSLKHFPGYGGNKDTHKDMVYDKRTLDELREKDFLPFDAGIAAGAPVVMVSHNIVSCIDGELPASLSPKVNALLREELGFEGAIMTDDLSMDAIRKFTVSEDAAVLAVLAGNDLLCSSDIAVQFEAVSAALEDGRISPDALDRAVLRILKLKLEYGVIKGQ
ncbi:MAG: glycoside hydrolase family 3 protein [Eubacteriales bacterium]